MPSLTSPLPPPSKKRRFSDADDDDAAAPEQHLAILSGVGGPRRWEKPDTMARGRDKSERWGLARRIMPVPVVKRARVADEESRRRTRSPACGGVAERDGKPARTSLAACHICHRRPTKKSVLDSFADCEGCGERTCFVCIRECAGLMSREAPGHHHQQQQQQQQREQGHHQQPQPQQRDAVDYDVQEALSRSFCMDDADSPEEEPLDGDERRDKGGKGEEAWGAGGHRAVVCSRCCVEMGRDGEIACLGCLSRMEGV